MPLTETDNTTEVPDHSTRVKRNPTEVLIGENTKRPTTRSNAKSATDYLLEQDRIGSTIHIPNKKRRYVELKATPMLDALVVHYTSLFKQRWNLLGRALEKHVSHTRDVSCYQNTAIIYLSHWTQDLYRMIRQSLISLDPIAFNEKYYNQIAVHSDKYDNFLATLTNHLKPTHITMTYADEVYIPVLSGRMNTTNSNVTGWSKFNLDSDVFNMILQIMEEKKLVTMTPLSTDLFGRPSWLFDWEGTLAAYAWFPQEANYNDDDVAVAYILGVACSPKLAHADFDEWKLSKEKPTLSASKLISYARVNTRRWRASAEFKVVQSEKIFLQNMYEKDKDKFKAQNKGPYALYADVSTKEPDAASTSDALAVVATESADDADYVSDLEIDPPPLDSPRTTTRRAAAAAEIAEANSYYRTRVVDYMYYKQVILRTDEATRMTAFRMFIKYNN